MSKTKQGGSTRLGRDSESKRLGIKASSGEFVKVGMVIIRQRGTKYLPGKNVKIGSDDTIYAVKNGIVRFSTKRKNLFNNSQRMAKVVSVDPVK
ncbi:MAG: 50S ribosomal protein L27 [Patescibacteria group bacterium]